MKNKRWVPSILFVGSGAWTCFTFIPEAKDFLDLKLPLPEAVRWIIFAILLVMWIGWVVYKMKNEDSENPGPALLEYLNHGMVSKNSNINVEAAKISISASESGNHTVLETPKLLQKVVWELQCANAGSRPQKYYELVVSLSSYSEWNDGVVDLSAVLEIGTSKFALDDFQAKEIPNAPDLRSIRFSFPQGIKVNRGGHFTIRVTLEWKQARIFKKDERIFFDPDNYGKLVNDIMFEVDLASSFFLDKKLNLYVVNKTTRTMKKVRTTPTRHENKTTWVMEPEENIMYYLRCAKK